METLETSLDPPLFMGSKSRFSRYREVVPGFNALNGFKWAWSCKVGVVSYNGNSGPATEFMHVSEPPLCGWYSHGFT